MSEYERLAGFYDGLTSDVDYSRFADFYQRLFEKSGLNVKTVLDFACGTGTLTWELAKRGYEMIGTDMSVEMLEEASSKSGSIVVDTAPMWLNQSMEELDLFGTVDAEVCSLDGMNYAYPEELSEIFHRLWLFLEPDGILIFDLIPPERLKSMDGQTFVDENESVFCVWRAEFDEEENACFYGMDIFSKDGEHWRRDFEEHVEYAHDTGEILEKLKAAGFEDICLMGEFSEQPPEGNDKRIFFSARKPKI